ncbi:APC family permease [Rubinisphaera margarita]|uniref:APC family permease n=1 Tax=Rubinisphaera margarita TaxID=2909586 RepID=UPI001EE7C333|nr:amino acid permease [Rubinisphaera margarita]MCG6157444.1 amino acid permease [Rubinisphaera margarita]
MTSEAPPANSLGLFSAIAIVVSSMVGAGLYTTSGFALADLGNPTLVMLAWLVGGVVALCGATSYGVLAAHFQESGGEYLFLARGVHPALGVLAGLVSMIAGFTGAIAFAASALESLVRDLIPAGTGLPGGTFALLAVGLATVQHLFRVRLGASIQNGMVALNLLLLTLFVAVAASQFPGGWEGLNEGFAGKSASVDPAVFATSLMWISLSYCGFNAAIYCSGEFVERGRTVRRALLLGTALVTLFYIAVNAVFVYSVAMDKVAGQEQVATIVAGELAGRGFAWVMGLTICVSLYTSVSALIMTGPRIYAQMAADGVLPRMFAFQGTTPRFSILVQAAAAMLMIAITSLQDLLTYLSFTLSLSSAITVASLFWIERDEKLSWSQSIAAGFFVVATTGIALLSASRHPLESISGLATLFGGLVIYLLASRWKSN